MRIGIDCAAVIAQKTGLGMYVTQLLGAIHRTTPPHTFVEITTIKRDLRTPSRIAWDQVGLPLVAAAQKVDLLFVPAFSAPRFRKPVIMTVHDIIGVQHPEFFPSPASRFYWSRLFPWSLHHADHWIAISEYTKNHMQTFLHIDSARITVIPPAASEFFQMINASVAIDAVLRRFRLRQPFVLSVGTREPRKNYARLVEAFALTRQKEIQLVIVGKKGWAEEDMHTAIRKFRLEERVRLVEYVTDEELRALYNACLFFILPSIAEGFGLPALEAMQCGAPVIAAQNTSLPEVVGDAGILCDPCSVESIRERMVLLMSDASRRQTMRDASLARARIFSWDRTARRTLEIFERV